MTEDDVRRWLRGALSPRGAATAFAKQSAMSDEAVFSFLRGAPLRPGLAAAIGYRRVTAFVPCNCYACTKRRTALEPGLTMFGQPLAMSRMFLCETCGNKRCPRAADHSNPCTESNAPGQIGSLYEDTPELEA